MTDNIKLPHLPQPDANGWEYVWPGDIEYIRAAVLADRERLKAEIGELEAERDSYKAEAELNMHRVITCGVAARNPDPELTRRGEYADKWNTDQAESVRKLREERDALLKDKARLDFMDQVAKRQGYDGFRLDYAIGDHEVLPGFLFHYRQRKENVGIRAVIDAARAAGGK